MGFGTWDLGFREAWDLGFREALRFPWDLELGIWDFAKCGIWKLGFGTSGEIK